MAIALDNASGLGNSGGASSWAPGFTVGSDSNRILFFCTHININNPSYITGVTYAGVAMTYFGQCNGTPGGTAITVQVWVLMAPASGTNNFAVSSGGGTVINGSAISYSGASQIGFPDAITTDLRVQASGVLLYTINLTTVAANCKIVEVLAQGSYAGAAGSSLQVIATAHILDISAPTPGANSISATSSYNGGDETAAVVFSFKEASAVLPPAGGLHHLQCAACGFSADLENLDAANLIALKHKAGWGPAHVVTLS